MKKFTIILLLLSWGCGKQIIDPAPMAIADFTWSEKEGIVTFINISTNAMSYLWDFGDGTTSTSKSTSKQYVKNGNYTVILTATDKNGKVSTLKKSVVVTGILDGIASVVDDPILAKWLSGKWSYYYGAKDDRRFWNFSYIFDEKSTKLKYESFTNSYYTLIDPDFKTINYNYKISNKIVYVDNKKHARIEQVSEDEMKWYSITETASSYNETLYNYTKLNDIEKPELDAIKNSSVGSAITSKKWTRKNSRGDEIILDFTTGKNFYNELKVALDGSISIQKTEYKINQSGEFYHRWWNSSIDCAWRKESVVVSGIKLKIGVNEYTLK